MNLTESIEILREHNEWRRWWEWEPTNPKELWEAIDTIIDNVEMYLI